MYSNKLFLRINPQTPIFKHVNYAKNILASNIELLTFWLQRNKPGKTLAMSRKACKNTEEDKHVTILNTGNENRLKINR